MTTYYYYIISAVVFILFLSAMGATRAQVIATYKKYSGRSASINITGYQFIMAAIKHQKLSDVTVMRTTKTLGDAYDLKRRVIVLSDEVLGTSSVAAISVAAHELGHALQHRDEHLGLQLSYFLGMVTGFFLRFLMPMVIAGVLLLIFEPNVAYGITLLYTAAATLVLALLIKLILIPVEFNASRRALKYLKENSVLSRKELIYAKRILNMAGLTYVSSFFDTIFKPLKAARRFVFKF